MGLIPRSKREDFHRFDLFSLYNHKAYPNTRTPNPGAMKFTILENALFLIITMYLVHLLNIQEQRKKILKN